MDSAAPIAPTHREAVVVPPVDPGAHAADDPRRAKRARLEDGDEAVEAVSVDEWKAAPASPGCDRDSDSLAEAYAARPVDERKHDGRRSKSAAALVLPPLPPRHQHQHHLGAASLTTTPRGTLGAYEVRARRRETVRGSESDPGGPSGKEDADHVEGSVPTDGEEEAGEGEEEEEAGGAGRGQGRRPPGTLPTPEVLDIAAATSTHARLLAMAAGTARGGRREANLVRDMLPRHVAADAEMLAWRDQHDRKMQIMRRKLEMPHAELQKLKALSRGGRGKKGRGPGRQRKVSSSDGGDGARRGPGRPRKGDGESNSFRGDEATPTAGTSRELEVVAVGSSEDGDGDEDGVSLAELGSEEEYESAKEEEEGDEDEDDEEASEWSGEDEDSSREEEVVALD